MLIGYNKARYAARLNAFKRAVPPEKDASIREMIAAAGRTGVLDAADLNFPDHFEGQIDTADIRIMLDDAGLTLNGLAMRYYKNPGYAIGALTNPDPAVRRAAINETKRGIDAGRELGSRLMTLWMGQDGFDYAFQGDYARMWDDTVAAMAEIADHDTEVDIAIEYKPNEPRAFALMPDVGTTLLAVREVDRPNMGVTLDFAHVLYADEMPAHTAHLIGRHSRLLGVHLNDGYGKRDDGLMAGTVHAVATVELFVELDRLSYDGVIYFDTFPDHSGLDPIREAQTNVALVEHLRSVAFRLKNDASLADAIARQDATDSQRIVAAALYGFDR